MTEGKDYGLGETRAPSAHPVRSTRLPQPLGSQRTVGSESCFAPPRAFAHAPRFAKAVNLPKVVCFFFAIFFLANQEKS